MSISYDDFKKVEMKVGKVLACEKVENTDKLLKLEVSFGEETRQIVSGIAEMYQSEDLVGKILPFVTNLEPRTIRGVESNGMILAAHDENDKPVLLFPDKDIPAGNSIS